MFTAVNIYGHDRTAVPYFTALTSQKKDLFEEKCTLMKKKLFYLKKCAILRAQFPFFDSPNATDSGEIHQMVSPCIETDAPNRTGSGEIGCQKAPSMT